MDKVIEVLYVVVISIPQILIIGIRDGSCFAPTLLQLLELLEGSTQMFFGIEKAFEFFDDFSAFSKVFFMGFLNLFIVLIALFAIIVESGVEFSINRNFVRKIIQFSSVGYELFFFLFYKSVVFFVELITNSVHLLFDSLGFLSLE